MSDLAMAIASDAASTRDDRIFLTMHKQRRALDALYEKNG